VGGYVAGLAVDSSAVHMIKTIAGLQEARTHSKESKKVCVLFEAVEDRVSKLDDVVQIQG